MPSEALSESLINLILAFGGPRPPSFGLGELYNDLADAINSGGGGGYIPNIVADGVTDNYATLVAYEAAFMARHPNGGLTSQVLPPGRVAISQTFVPTSGFYLCGSGGTQLDSTFNPNGPGTILCPTTSPTFTGTQVVRIDNDNCGQFNLSIDASNLAASAIQLNASQSFVGSSSGAYRGTVTTFDSTANTQSPRLIGYDIRSGVQDQVITALNAQGADWIVIGGRITHGAKVISVDGGQWLGVHFTHSSLSPNNFNVEDQGGSIYNGCYFDSCSPDAVALINRSGGGGNLVGSSFFGCRYYQNIAAVTGIPVFLIANENTGGTTVVGGWIKIGSLTGSSFTSLMQGAQNTDIAVGVSAEQAFTAGFYTGNQPPGSGWGNLQAGAAVSAIGPDVGVVSQFTGGTLYTLLMTDQNTLQVGANTITATFQIAQNSVEPLPIGATVSIMQGTATGKIVLATLGIANVFWAGGAFVSGTTGTRARYSIITLTKFDINSWVLTGDAV